MAIPTSLVGSSGGPIEHSIDARWTMAFAAAIDDTSTRYFDTGRPEQMVAHPLFAVCVEWPAILEAGAGYSRLGVPLGEILAGVHADHDLQIHRLIRPGDQLSTTAEVVAVEAIKPGARVTTRLRTTDAEGLPVATTTQSSIHLGVAVDGPDRSDHNPPTELVPANELRNADDKRAWQHTHRVEIRSGQAHRYTEGSRIWNPIHTDVAVARSAGLPDLILHGTSNLAYGISTLIDGLGVEPQNVRRIGCRFRAMVTMPSIITVVYDEPARRNATDDDQQVAVGFKVLNEDGAPAVDNGILVLDLATG